MFEEHERVETVILYGARAMGNYRNGCDIDLSIKRNLTRRDFYDILDQLDDLMLPYMMDISRFEALVNENLIDHINRKGQIFYERKKVLQ